MKDNWRKLYRENTGRIQTENLQVLTGFDAGIDKEIRIDEVEIDLSHTEAQKHGRIESMQDLREALAEADERNEALACEGGFSPDMEVHREILSGAGALSARFLNNTGFDTVLYSGTLSEKVTARLEGNIRTLKEEDGPKIVDKESGINTSETRKDTVFTSGAREALRLRHDLKGFGPYFRKGIEDGFGDLEKEIGLAILSGFHRAGGNIEAKIERAAKQLPKLDIPKHLDYRIMGAKASEKLIDRLLPAFDSINLDTEEMKQVSEALGLDTQEEPSIQNCLDLARKLTEEKNLERIHIHTERFQAVFESGETGSDVSEMRDSLLWAWNCSKATEGRRRVPREEDIREYDLQDRHVHRLDPLEEFAQRHGLKGFAGTGTGELEDLKVVCVPALREDGPRQSVSETVVSAGAFVAENLLRRTDR